MIKPCSVFLSTPSARRATGQHSGALRDHNISIHALREEGDLSSVPTGGGLVHFYPRPPRGGRPVLFCICAILYNFYPRPPRGGRRRLFSPWPAPWPISIHALREEGDNCNNFAVASSKISIHALREEGDPALCQPLVAFSAFLSTPSARRATSYFIKKFKSFFISIHALREEGDSKNRDKISIFL